LSTVSAALTLLSQLQSQGDELTQPGVFRGQRFNPYWGKYHREENNIFFALTVLHILKRVEPFVGEADIKVINEIDAKVKALLPYYVNPFDGLSYNYWPRFPAGHFPNGFLYHRSARFKAPDDIDDTGYAYAIWGPSIADFEALTKKVIPYCQGVTRRNHKIPKHLAALPAYNTWMGHHMAVDVDVCVLANYLPPMLAAKRDLNQYDEASLKFLQEVVQDKWYLKIPHLVCGYYLKVPVMAYHLARHLDLLPDPWQSKIRASLVRDWEAIVKTQEEPMHGLVLDSAARYLGLGSVQTVPMTLENVRQPYTCYYMGMITPLDFPVINQIADGGLFQVRKTCEAFNVALWIENQVLRAGHKPGRLWWS
jgi:hypothetical protein